MHRDYYDIPTRHTLYTILDCSKARSMVATRRPAGPSSRRWSRRTDKAGPDCHSTLPWHRAPPRFLAPDAIFI